MMRKPYPSDLTDEQGEIIQPLIPVHTVGRPRTVEMREVLNAIFYLVHPAGARAAGQNMELGSSDQFVLALVNDRRLKATAWGRKVSGPC